MRICIVSQEYPPDTAKGGIGTQALAKAEGLARRRHEVHVVSRSATGRPSEGLFNGVHVTRVTSARMAVYTEAADWLTYSAAVAETVADLHERFGLDLVEFPEWGSEGYVHLLNRSEWNRVPTIVHLHGPLVMLAETLGWPERDSDFYRVGRHMEGTCLRLADAIYSSSACSADWAARAYGLSRKAIPILHAGVDTETFRPWDVAKPERPTIAFAGKVARNKGIGVLLEATLNLADEFPGLQLRVLGRGEREVIAELRDAAARRGRPDVLDLAGFVDRQNLPEYLSTAHVFAAPSRYEGGPGFVYLEAMACGLPVIACEGSGAAEVILPGETGFLVPPDDVGTLTQVLRSLLADPRGAEAIGCRARRYVLESADSEACLDRLEAFYTVAAQRAAPASFRREAIV